MRDLSSEIKRLVPMTLAAPFYGVEVGAGGYARCPFHGEKTGSLKVYDGDRGWHCYGCHKGGSVIDFVMELFGLSVIEAEKRLDADFQLGLFTDAEDAESRQKAARAARERKKELERRDRRHRIIYEAYDAALTAFAIADMAVDAMKEVPPVYWTEDQVVSLMAIDGLWYDLCVATAALRKFERENRVSGIPRPGTGEVKT